MRQVSKRTQYGLRALYALAENYGRGPTLITQLAHDEAIPKKFLEQILLTLKEAGYVSSKKGKGGGYALAQPPDQITLASVIRAMEGPIAPLPCASDMRFRKCDECPDVDTCGTRIVMREVRDAMVAILDKTTLTMVARKVHAAEKRKRAATTLTYDI
ncbi:MAG TPA: Rrf2 family transcriptional regulator [Bryobacteraceae bacterium]|nr:Rrf2 family transcriptional regulator [Bryobacteraceae bacterium]